MNLAHSCIGLELTSYPCVLCLIAEKVENSNAILRVSEIEKLDEPKTETISECVSFDLGGVLTLCTPQS